MKYVLLFFCLALVHSGFSQSSSLTAKQQNDLRTLIDQYSLARENRDTVLLKKILTTDVDQLVSNGEWRVGIQSAIQGMLKSSASRPGTRILIVEKMKWLSPTSALVDCRYEIRNDDGSLRKMWSSFIVVSQNNQWRISAIRNMLPSAQ